MRRSNKPQNKWPSYYIERLTGSLENLSDVDRQKAHTSIKLIKKSVDCHVAEIKLKRHNIPLPKDYEGSNKLLSQGVLLYNQIFLQTGMENERTCNLILVRFDSWFLIRCRSQKY